MSNFDILLARAFRAGYEKCADDIYVAGDELLEPVTPTFAEWREELGS